MSDLKIIVGAGGKTLGGFISTEQSSMDITRLDHFRPYAAKGPIRVILMEHVLEHLTYDQGLLAVHNCRESLQDGGAVLVAVPDGMHRSREYLEWVKPGGTGPGSEDHKILYDYQSLSLLLIRAGFSEVTLFEWWDDQGVFHYRPYDEEKFGRIDRSYRHDHRNKPENPYAYTSLIVMGVR